MESEDQFGTLSEKSAIAAISKRKNAMKILVFLFKDVDNEETYYLQRIADELEMCEMTAFQNLNKLIDAGIVEKTETKVDRRTKYYIITNKKLAEKAIKKYEHRVGFELARLVPYTRLYCSQFRKDTRFIEACKDFGLSLSEGLSAVINCFKIGKENSGTDTILWRKEQGYDEPEKEKPSYLSYLDDSLSIFLVQRRTLSRQQAVS